MSPARIYGTCQCRRREKLDIRHKALTLNLDLCTFSSFAEMGWNAASKCPDAVIVSWRVLCDARKWRNAYASEAGENFNSLLRQR
jgi:hypothetical protein